MKFMITQLECTVLLCYPCESHNDNMSSSKATFYRVCRQSDVQREKKIRVWESCHVNMHHMKNSKTYGNILSTSHDEQSVSSHYTTRNSY